MGLPKHTIRTTKEILQNCWYIMKDVKHLQNVREKLVMLKGLVMSALRELRNPNKFPLVVKYIGETQIRNSKEV